MNQTLLGRVRLSLSIFLSALIVAWAPGLAPYQAIAGTISGGFDEVSVGRVSLPALGLPAGPAMEAPGVELVHNVADLIQQAQGAIVLPPALQTAHSFSAQATLASGAREIAKAQSPSGVRDAVEKLFSGRAQASASDAGAVSGSESDHGNDFSNLDARRYDENRRDLAFIAEKTGIVASLPAASGSLKSWLLGQAAGKKVVFSDYDDTIEGHMVVASPESVEAILAVKKAGKQVVIVTDRPDVPRSEKTENSILHSLSSIPAEQRAGIIVAANKGARIVQYDAAGESKLIYEEPQMTEQEKQNIREAAGVVKGELASLGTSLHDGSRDIPAEGLEGYGYAMMLKAGTPEAVVRQVRDRLQAELAARGIKENLIPRFPKNPLNPPYVTFSRLDKSLATRRVAEILKIQAKDALIVGDSMYVPSWSKPSEVSSEVAQAAARAGLDLNTPLPSALSGNSADRDMERGLPGAMTLSVGGTADPRIENGFVMPGKGPSVTREVFRAVASEPVKTEAAPPAPKPAEETVNKKALIGLFVQRSISIVAFIAITIAYPFAAVPVVGWQGLGILMSFSPAMGLAAGPISGIIIDKLSPRNAMIVNTIMRGTMLLLLPAFHYFGVLNFWTLLLAALADGFLLSSIMNTESGSLKKIFPAKSLGPINSGLFTNYLGLQVLFGLVLLLGSVVDKFNPFNVFAVSAGINLLVVLPIVWATIPNIAPVKQALAKKKGSPAAFLKRYWKEAVLAAVTVAVFPLVHTSLPISAAILYWIARTDAFKALWNGTGGEQSKEAAELLARKARLEQLPNKDYDPTTDYELAQIDAQLKREKGRMRSAMLSLALGAMMMYPLQYFGLPHVAEALASASGKGVLLGQFLGSLFFGNLISTAAQAKMPEVKVPFFKKPIAGQRLIQAGVLGLAALWVATRLVPGSALAAVVAMGVAAGLMAIATKLTSRGWLTLFGVGFSAIWLPFAVWTWPALLPFLTVKTAMLASLIAIGMSYGPSWVSAMTYFMSNAKKDRMGEMIGIQGSFFNAAISIGYGLLTLASGLAHPAFPALLAVLGVAYAVAGAIFARWPKLMPGLPKDLFLRKPKAKS